MMASVYESASGGNLYCGFLFGRAGGWTGYFSIEWEGAGYFWVENGKLIEQSLQYLG
jgi:hypothetical protein